MDDMHLEPGTVLAEKYRLGSVLGVGGMGTVYIAEHLALKAPVAIKVIDREVVEGDVALARFMREAQAAAALRSPHVVQILDYGMEGKRPFMVMEMLEGEPLSDRIKRAGRLPPAETLRVISHVAKAVSKAHEADIVHRDLKPDNIFLVHNEGDEIAKVLDFGVAKVDATALDGEGHTRTGSLLGTPYYMSPEQAQGNKDIDSRSDLWALGVIAFECLTGARPFSSDGLGDLVLQICIRDIPRPSDYGEVPPSFDAWFFKACEREPQDRFQSARQLSEELRSALKLDGDAAPEYRWSAAASLPPSKAIRNLEDKTTQPDEEPSLASDPNLSLDESEEEDQKEEASNVSPDGLASSRAESQWEVVPHGQKQDRKKPHLSYHPENNAEPIEVERKSAVSSVVFVAITALLLGGAIVFGIKQAGVELPSTSSPSPQAQSKGPNTPRKPHLSSKKKNNKKKKASPEAKTKTHQNNESQDETPEAPMGEDEGEGKTQGEGVEDSPLVEDPLDAIESEAARALAERNPPEENPEQTETPSEDPPGDKGSTPKQPEPGGTHPEPRVPDSLAAPPAPPPSPQ